MIADLNKSFYNKALFVEKRVPLFSRMGSKHSFDDAPEHCKFPREYFKVVVVREPTVWLDARARYYRKLHPEYKGDISFAMARKWLQVEWNAFYESLIKLSGELPNFIFVKYEDILLDYRGFLTRVGEQFNLSVTCPCDIEVVLSPSGRANQLRDPAAYVQVAGQRTSTFKPVVDEHASPRVLEFMGYFANAEPPDSLAGHNLPKAIA